MSTLGLPVKQPPSAQLRPLNPDPIATDPSLLAAIDAFSAELQLTDQGEGDFWEHGPLSTTLPNWGAGDLDFGNPSLGGATARNSRDSHVYNEPHDDKRSDASLCTTTQCRPDGPPDHRRRRGSDDHSHGESNNNGRARRRKSTGHSSARSDGQRDEKAQRAKFLEGNRISASKCRQKKKEQTMSLESRYMEQSVKKDALMADFAGLRFETLGLRNEVLKHAECDDNSIKRHLERSTLSITHSGSVLCQNYEYE